MSRRSSSTPELKIRFFTPATKSLFSVIPSRCRPAARRPQLAGRGQRPADRCRDGAADAAPIEREIEARTGAWYIRRILPYRTQDDAVEGVVITFADITERRRTADALEAAERRRSWPMPRSRAFSPPRATTCASRCKRWRCFTGCWRRPQGGEGAEAGRTARRNAGRHVGHAERDARHKPDRSRYRPRRNGRLPDQRSARTAARRIRLSRAGERAHFARGPVPPFDSRAIRVCSSR